MGCTVVALTVVCVVPGIFIAVQIGCNTWLVRREQDNALNNKLNH